MIDAATSLGKSTIYTATTDGVVVVDGEMIRVRDGDALPYPLARVIETPPEKITARFGRHPRG